MIKTYGILVTGQDTQSTGAKDYENRKRTKNP